MSDPDAHLATSTSPALVVTPHAPRGARFRAKQLMSWMVILCVVFAMGSLPGARHKPVPRAPTLAEPVRPGELATVDVVVTSATRGRVRAFRGEQSGFRLTAEQEVVDGKASLRALPWGDYWFTVDADGRARASSHVLLAEAERLLTFTPGVGHSFEVQATDEQGAGLAGVDVEVRAADPIPIGLRTDANGRARTPYLGHARVVVVARKSGYEEVQLPVVDGAASVALTMHLLSAVLVQVKLPSGQPAARARVQIASVQLWPPRYAETREDGSVRISGLVPGSYALRATLGSQVSHTEIGTVIRGETGVSTLTLEQGYFAAVEVVEDGEDHNHISRVKLVAAEEGLSGFPEEAMTDSKGKASIGPLLRGNITISAAHADYVAAPADSYQLPSAATIRITLGRGATLEVRVRDSAGRAVEGATLRVVGTDLLGNPVEDDPQRSAFRASHFAMLERGPTALVAAGDLGMVPGVVPAGPRAMLAPIATASAAPSVLPPPPLAGKTPSRWVSDRGGMARLAPVTAGRLRVLVQHPEFVETLSDAIALAADGTGKLDVVLNHGGSLEGKVVDSRGQTQQNVVVRMASDRGSREATTMTATDGSFAFAAAASHVTLTFAHAEAPQAILLNERISVPENERKRAVFTLPAQREDVRLRVEGERGLALENAQVSWLSLVPGQPARQTVFTDARGEAVLRHARGLLARLEIRAPRFAVSVHSTELVLAEQRFILSPAESLAGEVRSERGERLAGVSVQYACDGLVLQATSDDNGEYQFAEVSAGAARLRFRKVGYAAFERAFQVGALGGRRVVEVPRTELRAEAIVEGVVVDGKGKPVFGARIARDVAPVFLTTARAQLGVATTNAQGRFVLDQLTSGSAILHAYAPEVGRGKTEPLELAPGRTRRDVRIVLDDSSVGTRDIAGATVAVTLGETADPREILIVHVGDGSAAQRAGVAVHDVLVAVDGVHPKSLEQARHGLSGPPSDVVLLLRRDGHELTLRVSRESVNR
jgi:protocatechuate 3,4-dioxygenase beta subunit